MKIGRIGLDPIANASLMLLTLSQARHDGELEGYSFGLIERLSVENGVVTSDGAGVAITTIEDKCRLMLAFQEGKSHAFVIPESYMGVPIENGPAFALQSAEQLVSAIEGCVEQLRSIPKDLVEEAIRDGAAITFHVQEEV